MLSFCRLCGCTSDRQTFCLQTAYLDRTAQCDLGRFASVSLWNGHLPRFCNIQDPQNSVLRAQFFLLLHLHCSLLLGFLGTLCRRFDSTKLNHPQPIPDQLDIHIRSDTPLSAAPRRTMPQRKIATTSDVVLSGRDINILIHGLSHLINPISVSSSNRYAPYDFSLCFHLIDASLSLRLFPFLLYSLTYTIGDVHS